MTFSRHEKPNRWWPAYFVSLLLFVAVMPRAAAEVCQFAESTCCRVGDRLDLLMHEATMRTMEHGYPF